MFNIHRRNKTFYHYPRYFRISGVPGSQILNKLVEFFFCGVNRFDWWFWSLLFRHRRTPILKGNNEKYPPMRLSTQDSYTERPYEPNLELGLKLKLNQLFPFSSLGY